MSSWSTWPYVALVYHPPVAQIVIYHSQQVVWNLFPHHRLDADVPSRATIESRALGALILASEARNENVPAKRADFFYCSSTWPLSKTEVYIYIYIYRFFSLRDNLTSSSMNGFLWSKFANFCFVAQTQFLIYSFFIVAHCGCNQNPKFIYIWIFIYWVITMNFKCDTLKCK